MTVMHGDFAASHRAAAMAINLNGLIVQTPAMNLNEQCGGLAQ